MTNRNRIRELREAAGLTLDELAARSVPRTTNQQISRLERGERRLTTGWMERIAPALGCRPHDLLVDDADHDEVMNAASANKRLSLTQMNTDLRARRDERQSAGYQPLALAHQVMVRGEVAAGVWQEAAEWPQGDWYPISMPSSRYDGLPQFALVVRGHSMDLIYPEGTIVMCVPLFALRRQPTSGEKVVVERRHRGLVEATVKELAIGQDGSVILWPRSSKPQFQAPLELPKGTFGPGESDYPGLAEEPAEDASEIRVTALVVASLRFEA